MADQNQANQPQTPQNAQPNGATQPDMQQNTGSQSQPQSQTQPNVSNGAAPAQAQTYTQTQNTQQQANQNQTGQAGYWNQPTPGQTQQQNQQATYQQPVAPGQPVQPVRQSDASLTLGTWVVTVLLTMIPIVGIVMLFIWGFDSTTAPARRNYARAMLIWKAVEIVLFLICGSALILFLEQIFGYYDSSMYDYGMDYMMSYMPC